MRVAAPVLLLIVLLLAALPHAQGSGGVLVVRVRGEITQATELTVRNALRAADGMGARLVVMLLDTPGGSVDSVKNIMVMMEESRVPVAVFVYPVGATAWSGGVYILMASHIAVMASGTSIGSAQPIIETVAGPVFVNESKIINALAGLIEHHARIHSRNVTAARLFVTQNLNMGPEEALRSHVVEFVADTVDDFLLSLESKALVKIRVGHEYVWRLVDRGEAQALSPVSVVDFGGVAGEPRVDYVPGPQVYILGFLTNPLIAVLLLMIGLFTLSIGLKTPGYGMEIAGALMIAASIVGLGVIGAEAGGAIFMAIGFILILAELKTHIGALAILGSVSLIFGSLMLIPSGSLLLSAEEMTRIWVTLVGAGLTLTLIFSVIVFKVAKAMRRKPAMGPEALIGATGTARTDLDPEGEVRVKGEIWRGRSVAGPIPRGSKVRVVRREGLTLYVERVD